MTKNKLLNIVIALCKCAQLLYLITFVILTGLFIHFQIDKSFYEDIDLSNKVKNKDLFLHISTYKESTFNTDKTKNKVFTLKKIETTSLYIQYIKYTLMIVLSLFSFREFEKIIKSVKSLQTFRKSNVISFRRIGAYIITIFILTSYSSINFKNGNISYFNISISFLSFTTLPFIMAEVFKEGKSLQEENDLTI